MYKNFLFDLDGTLLPMDMEYFTKLYFSSLCKRFVPVLNVDSDTLVKAIWKGTGAMTKNDNSRKNKDVFWKTASAECGIDLTPYIEQFDDYSCVHSSTAGYNRNFIDVLQLIKRNAALLKTG